ncbi:MAG: transglutaminase domain-containing protein [Firmicutes bacterium]|nr:transglutaminase domain-containing protein [Bacillota bacterium]
MKYKLTALLMVILILTSSCTNTIQDFEKVSEEVNQKSQIIIDEKLEEEQDNVPLEQKTVQSEPVSSNNSDKSTKLENTQHRSDLEQIYLSADDPNNPLSVFRVPITQEIVYAADEILQGKKDLAPHQKILLFMDFMKDFEVGKASDSKPETTIKERIGACGTFTNLLLALAKTQGIEGRVINLANFPQNTGHAVAELCINGKWSVYDPTYAAYFTNTPNDERTPNVLSFKELRDGKGYEPEVVRVVGNQQRFEKGNPLYFDVGPEIYMKASPAGPIGPEKPFIYPLSLDLKTKPRISQEDINNKNQGSDYIGAAGINNFQEWSLSSLIPGKKYKLVVIPDWIGGEMINETQYFQATAKILSGGYILDGVAVSWPTGKKQLDPWSINFVAQTDKVQILIEHPYRGPKFHYIMIKGYQLDPN